MKISLKWLNDYIKLDKSAQEIADQLSLSSFPVESIESQIDDKIVVAEIKEIKPHQNADKLRIAIVDDGDELLQIVCGASNIEVGQKVPLAQIGAKIGDTKIKKAELRGVESFGILCSERELGLSDNHSGIKILSDNYKVGRKLNEYIGSDSILDIEITPNRGDCLSHIGIARELSAINKIKLGLPSMKNNFNNLGEDNISVIIEADDLCPQYYALEISNVKVEESPKWLKDRIESVGIHSINNIVDITNYVMMEFGHPLHAFDADKIKNKKIIVRKSGENEKVTTLDNKVKNIPEESLVISDEDKIIAIAGIMGASNSQVTNVTTNIILESAEFNRKSVRKTSKELGISTDASYRFERGIDSGNVLTAIKRAADLILELGHGKFSSLVENKTVEKEITVDIDYKKINALLGIDIIANDVNEILEYLGFVIKNNKVLVPRWRHDINIWQDLAEEIGRIYGYNKIKSIEIEKSELILKSDFYKIEFIKDRLRDNGLSEVRNYIYLSEKDIETAKIDNNNLLEIVNPLQRDYKYLRNSIIPGLLKNIAKNPSFDQVFMFEIGNTFTTKNEECKLGTVTAGRKANEEINTIADMLVENCKIAREKINIIELNRDELTDYKIKKPIVYSLEISINDLLANLKVTDKELELKTDDKKILYVPVSQFPPLARDVAFIVDKKADNDDMSALIKSSSDKIFLVELFDEFMSDKFGGNKKNVAFHIWMQETNKAMTDDQANVIMNNIISKFEEKYNAALRS